MTRWILAMLPFVLIPCAHADAMTCPSANKSEKALAALVAQLFPESDTIIASREKQALLTEFVVSRDFDGWCHDQNDRSNDIRMTGPFLRGHGSKAIGYMTHARVRVFYSEQVVEWLKGGRVGAIPDHAMIVKEMYSAPGILYKNNDGSEIERPSGWAVMVRDSKASHDGWLWFLYYQPGNTSFNKLEYVQLQYGTSFCLACHSSVDNDQSTFAFLGNLTGNDVASYLSDKPTVVTFEAGKSMDLSPPSHAPALGELGLLTPLMYAPVSPPLAHGNLGLYTLLVSRLPGIAEHVAGPGDVLPPDAFYDHIVSPAGENKRMFLTSDQCQGCHDASSLLVPNTSELTVDIPASKRPPVPKGYTQIDQLNVSPYGEWSASMMGKSGRDPVFLSQLESERARVPAAAGATTELCSTCHGVMGKRTHPALARSIDNYFAVPPESEPTPDGMRAAEFGALARDGVSCTVCHHISGEGLGTPETYTGNFKTGPAKEIYGPYDDVVTYPMTQALGVEPVHGAQIQDSALCGSCHTVEVPVYHNGERVKSTLEQTTYLEWRNSSYSDPKTGKPCYECHMPAYNPTDPKHDLDMPIARVEDGGFPYVANRANPSELDTKPRKTYRRHTLVGLNSVTMAMFQQFPELLGSNTFFPNRTPNVLPPPLLAMQEVHNLAAATAAVEVDASKSDDGTITLDVTVKNLAGHKFPSGVNFRRAFLEVALFDGVGRRLWCSGCTDSNGVIQGATGPLPSEFATSQDELQPDHDRITTEDAVQVYESRHADCDDMLTTSFLGLCTEVKDNRILPDGWSPRGYRSDDTEPVPSRRSSRLTPGVDVISYAIERTDALAAASYASVRLNYQALPPYYLVDRFRGIASGDAVPQAQRLLYLATRVNLDDAGVGSADWKLQIGQAMCVGLGDSTGAPCKE